MKRLSSDLASENSPSRHSSVDDLTLLNNNNDSKDCGDMATAAGEQRWLASSMVEQTRCLICGADCTDFAEMEAHCLSEHIRSPCMYCPKTFAQKANRDRHMCLHTGDRPYGCPECGERFSRGDKLKMHRVRTHGVLYPLYGSRGGGQRDRDGGGTSNSHSASRSPPMTLDCSDPGAAVALTASASLSNGGHDGNSPMVSNAAGDLQGSTNVMSGGEWIDLRISVCRDSSKLQSALAGMASPPSPPDHRRRQQQQQRLLEKFALPPRETATDAAAAAAEVAATIRGNI